MPQGHRAAQGTANALVSQAQPCCSVPVKKLLLQDGAGESPSRRLRQHGGAAPSAAGVLASIAPSQRHPRTSRENLREDTYSKVPLRVQTLQHAGGLFVRQLGRVKIPLLRKEMPGSSCSPQITAIRTGPGFVLKAFLTAAVPKQLLRLILFGDHDSPHTTGML